MMVVLEELRLPLSRFMQTGLSHPRLDSRGLPTSILSSTTTYCSRDVLPLELICGQLERLLPMRLHGERLQPTVHGGFGDPCCCS